MDRSFFSRDFLILCDLIYTTLNKFLSNKMYFYIPTHVKNVKLNRFLIANIFRLKHIIQWINQNNEYFGDSASSIPASFAKNLCIYNYRYIYKILVIKVYRFASQNHVCVNTILVLWHVPI